MTTKTRISTADLSVRLINIANIYGFKTVGSFYKFLKQCNPSAKLCVGLGHSRATMLLKELERELNKSL